MIPLPRLILLALLAALAPLPAHAIAVTERVVRPSGGCGDPGTRVIACEGLRQALPPYGALACPACGLPRRAPEERR